MQNKKYVFVDLETTGKMDWNGNIPSDAKIIQFAGIVTDKDFNILDTFESFYAHEEVSNTFFHKGQNKDVSFAELTGLSYEFLKSKAEFKDIQSDTKIKEFLKQFDNDVTFVAYNSYFEETFIKHYLGFAPKWKCLMKTYRNLKNKLGAKEMDMLIDLGVPFEEDKLHNALYDISMCIDAAKRIRELYSNGGKLKETPEAPSSKAVDFMNQLLNKKDETVRKRVSDAFLKNPTAYSAYIVSGLINNLKNGKSDKHEFMEELGAEWIRRIS